MTKSPHYPLTPIAGGRSKPSTALDRAKEHKAETSALGMEVGRQLIDEMAKLQATAAGAEELGDYLPPGVKQAAADIQRELRAIRERLEVTMGRGTA